MELASPPKSPRTVQVSQQSIDYGTSFNELNQLTNALLKQQKQDIKKANSETLEAALSNHREEILNALNGRINERCNSLILQLKATNDSVKKLENQNRIVGIAFLCTALGLSLNFIMFTYLWHYIHK
jgi:hypothetical protein